MATKKDPNTQVPEGYRYDKERDRLFVVPGGIADPNTPVIPANKGVPVGPEGEYGTSTFPFGKGKTTDTTTGVVEESLFEEQKEPETIDEAVIQKVEAVEPQTPVEGMTYEEQAEQIQKGSYLDFAQAYEKTMGKPAPFKTQQEYLDWRSKQNADDLSYLESQADLARQAEGLQMTSFREQMGGAIGATQAMLAQSREGAMSGTAPLLANNFVNQMRRKEEQIVIQQQSAELARDKAKKDLLKAQEAGDMDMVEAIQGQIASIEADLRQIDTEALDAATLANEQVMKAMEIQSAKSESVSASIFSMGSAAGDLSVSQLQSMIAGTDLTIDQAIVLQKAAALQGQADESKNELEKAKLQAEVNDLMATAGKTTGQLDFEYYQSLSSEAQKSYMTLKGQNPSYQLVDMGDGKYGAYDSDKGNISVIYSPSNIDENSVIGAFYQSGASDYDWGEGKRECGEAYNDITDGKKVGDEYSTKMGAVTKQSVPQVGNGLVIPIGDPNIGHIETVIEVNGDMITTMAWNHNGDGQQTIETYSVNQLNDQYRDNWGFTDSTLKTEYAEKLNAAQYAYDTSTPEGNLAQSFRDAGTNLGYSGSELDDFVNDRIADSYKPMTEAQGKAYNAYVIMNSENATYDALMQDIDMEEFADAINTITRKATESGTEVTGDLINKYVVDDNIRQAMMSEFRWLEGALREESGAAITPAEYSTKGTAFFPRFGDDPVTIEQKKKARELSTEGKITKAGPSGERLILESEMAVDTQAVAQADIDAYGGYVTNSQYLSDSVDTMAW